MSPIKVLIADDHALIRQGIHALLSQEQDIEVVAEAEDGKTALELAEKLQPDVILMDIAMEGLNGLEATRLIHSRCPQASVLILSMYTNEEFVFQALRSGAKGYILKQGIKDELIRAIRTVYQGEQYLASPIAQIVVDGLLGKTSGVTENTSRLENLTSREREILQLITEEYTSPQIADRLMISVKTVERHRANLMEKLNIHSTAGLVRFAIEAGLVKLDK